MDELYRLHSSMSCSDNYSIILGFNEINSTCSDASELIKFQIANHPLYPNLVSAYIQCRKVGASPEMTLILEEISRESILFTTCSEIGNDPELDEFMESYCEALHKYKEEFSKPFDEATTFFNDIESQLSSLCKETLITKMAPPSLSSGTYLSDEVGGTSDEDLSYGEPETAKIQESGESSQGGNEVKEMLMNKYSGYLIKLKKEFLKKRKRVKLPKNATIALMNWWTTHHRWPYPTEEEKMKLSEITGLNQKQVNNWFINQRKRHWRPSDDMRLALMDGVSGNIAGSMYIDVAGGTGSIGT